LKSNASNAKPQKSIQRKDQGNFQNSNQGNYKDNIEKPSMASNDSPKLPGFKRSYQERLPKRTVNPSSIHDNSEIDHFQERDIESYNEELERKLRAANHEKFSGFKDVLLICQEIKENNIKPNVATYNYFLEALLTKNQLVFGIKMLNEMIRSGLQPDSTTLNLLIALHVKFGDFLGAMSIFELFDQFGIKPTKVTFSNLIDVATKSPAHAPKVEFLVREMVHEGFYSPVDAINAIDHLIYNNKVDEAYEILKLMEQQGKPVPLQAYHLVLGSLCQTDNNAGVKHCFKNLQVSEDLEYPFDEGTIIELLKHAKKNKDLQLANQAFLCVEQKQIPYQDFYFIPLLDLLSHYRDYPKLFEILLLMKSLRVHYSFKAFTDIIYEISKKPENMDDAFFALEDLKQNKKIDLNAFNIVLAGCAHGKDVERTFATYSEIQKFGLKPDLETIHILLNLCLKTRQKKLPEKVWPEIAKNDLKPSAETYSKYIEACLYCGEFAEAQRAYNFTEANDVFLFEGAYVRLIQSFGPNDKAFGARILENMRKAGFNPGKTLVKIVGNQDDEIK